MATTVILGGGVGGLVTANTLRRRLDPKHRVVLVDRSRQHVFTPSFLWMMLGWREPRAISRDLARLSRKGIEVVQEEIREIDPVRRRVRTERQEIAADHLVVSLGAEGWLGGLPGLAEAGHNLYDLGGTLRLRDALSEFRGGRVAVLIAGLPFKCPAAPYEAAMLLEADLRRRGMRDRVTIDLYSPEPGPMGVAGPEVSAMVRQMVESKGIAYHPEQTVAKIDPAARRIYFTNDTTASFDLLAYVPPHRAPQVVRDAGLCGESGWIPVDRGTLETKYAGVYAIGDVTGIPLAIGKPLPKAAVFAQAQAQVVAHNIVRAVTGQGESHSFQGQGSCFIEIGDGRAGFGSGNFYAEPKPQIALYPPSRLRHFGKVAYAKFWLFKWF